MLHNCDNPPCVNFWHLFPGSQQDNLDDARKKRRLATGTKNGKYLHPDKTPRGIQCSFAKLTEQQIRDIRLYSTQGWSQRKLGAAFGVSKTMIASIISRQSWAHIN